MTGHRGVPPVPTGVGPEANSSGDPARRLVELTAAGDHQAFAELYDLTARRVHSVVLRVIQDHAMAEEVTQEVFLEIWRTAARFDPERGRALTWILTVAHRRAVDRVRSVAAARRREATYQVDIPYDVTVERVEEAERATLVRRALASLSDVQRGALELAYFGGHTHAEVAELLGLPLGTAKTRIRDGMNTLRLAVGGQT